MPESISGRTFWSHRSLTRRTLLGSLAIGGALTAVACATPAASPTAAPAPTTASSTAKPAAQPPTASQPAATAAATQAPAQPKAVQKWRIAIPEIKADSVFQMMGLEKGFFREEGIDAEIIGIAAGTTTVQGVVAGEFNMGVAGPSAEFPAIEKGADLRIIGTLYAKMPHVLYVHKDISSIEDLVGKNVGTNGPGALLHVVAYAMFAQAGLDPEQINYVNVGGSPAVFRAVVQGKVEGGVAGSEYINELKEDPSIPVKVLMPVTDLLPNYLRNGDVVSYRSIQDDKDLVVRALTAYVRGARHAVENRADAVAWMTKNDYAEEAAANAIWEEMVQNKQVNTNYRIPREQIEFTQQVGVQSGSQAAVLPYERVATDEIADAVLQRIGTHTY